MENQGPVKSVIISGNLQNDLVYKLCPPTEFSEGVWNIAINDIGFQVNVKNFEALCQISSNIVKAQKYNDSFEVESYDQPFGIFTLKSKEKTTIHFGKVQ